MSIVVRASVLLALAAPLCASAESSSELSQIRQAIEALKRDHEARLQALEARLRAAEAAATGASPGSSPGVPPLAASPSPTPPVVAMSAPAAPVPATPAGSFNPAMSVILSGLYTRTSRDPAGYAIAGFARSADAEVGPGTRGFSLAETEIGLSAQVDPWLRGTVNLALGADDSMAVEEAYLQTTAMGHGLTLTAGRFKSAIGYLNPHHAHQWDFVDAPLAYQALLGGADADDGVQLKWVAPTDTYVSLGIEAGRGRRFPGGGDSRNGLGRWALTAHVGGDWGDSHSWQAGLSVLQSKAVGQAWTLDGDLARAFTGRTRVWVADAVWKWAPQGNASRTSVKLQGEWLRSERRGEVADEAGGVFGLRSAPSGGYLQAVWQFMPRWRVGLRGDWLDPGSVDPATGQAWSDSAFKPRRRTLMLDFSPSEFSRVRWQLAQDRARPGAADTQFQLQYQVSLGAHGAHAY